MASAMDSRLAYARLSAGVATASRLPTATRGSNNSYTTSWDTTGAFTGPLDEYVLLSDEPEHEFKNDDWVDFRKYKEFTAERSAPTPVAEARKDE